jgi:hypothetical protein
MSMGCRKFCGGRMLINLFLKTQPYSPNKNPIGCLLIQKATTGRKSVVANGMNVSFNPFVALLFIDSVNYLLLLLNIYYCWSLLLFY